MNIRMSCGEAAPIKIEPAIVDMSTSKFKIGNNIY